MAKWLKIIDSSRKKLLKCMKLWKEWPRLLLNKMNSTTNSRKEPSMLLKKLKSLIIKSINKLLTSIKFFSCWVNLSKSRTLKMIKPLLRLRKLKSMMKINIALQRSFILFINHPFTKKLSVLMNLIFVRVG